MIKESSIIKMGYDHVDATTYWRNIVDKNGIDVSVTEADVLGALSSGRLNAWLLMDGSIDAPSVKLGMTQAEYAAHKGYTDRARVTQLKQDGKLVWHFDGTIDVEASDRRIAETVGHRVKPARRHQVADDAPTDAIGDDAVESIDGAKRRRAIAEANLAELDEARRRGDLIPVSDAEETMLMVIVNIFAAIEAIPDTMADKLASRQPHEINILLTERIHEARTEAVERIEQMRLAK